MVGLLGTAQTKNPSRPHDLISSGVMRISSYPLNAKGAAFISKELIGSKTDTPPKPSTNAVC